MIAQELRELKTDRSDLKKFGLLVGGVFTLLGAWFFFRKKPFYLYALVPGAILMLLGVLVPHLLRRVYMAWMAMALVLGLIVSTVLLSLLYFLVITPIAILARLAGKDFMARAFPGQTPSYWIPRTGNRPVDAKEYEQQY